MPDNESSAKIDTAIAEAIGQFEQRIKALDAGVDERIIADDDLTSITEAKEAVRQLIKDLDATVQRTRAARRER